jgi:HK97 family phage major capsid protein
MKEKFSFLAMALAKATRTWGRIDSHEYRVVSDLIERNGLPDSGYDPTPGYAWRATPLTTDNSANGGYITGTEMVGYLPALQAQSNLLRLGATKVQLGKGNTTMPRGVTAIDPIFLHDEVTPTVTTAPTFGSLTFARKNMLVAVTLTRQQLLQSDADEIVRTEMLNALAAEIDEEGISGNGLLGTPLGILNNPTISSASGASLAYSTIVAAMTAVANGNAAVNLEALGFLTTPTIAGLLKQRYFSTANFPIWNGSVPSGTIDNQPAYSSTNVPAGNFIHADWSRLLIAEWSDGVQIDVDPFTNFQQAYTTIRLCCSVDFQIASAASFNILTGVT